MSRPLSQSLERYARRRFGLSGMSDVSQVFPFCRPIEAVRATASGDNRSFVSFANYDYLGLADDPRIRTSVQQAIDEVGVGVGASRLVGGERQIHRELEAEMAAFLGVEDVLSLVSGYGTNVGLVGHLLTKDDLIVIDEAAHHSIMAGADLARARSITFEHNDLQHLAEILASQRGEYARVLIIVEGLYSMDGDVPDLPNLLAICRRHDAWLMIDEAHSIGVLGETGRGITEHFGIPTSDVDLIVGTFSKAFASCGGFIAARQDVVDWLRFTLPSFVYSVGLPPPSAAAARAALGVLEAEPERLAALAANSLFFLTAAKGKGLNVGNAVGAGVVPVLFPDNETTIAAARAALEAGYFVPPIGQIAVPKDKPRLRFFVTSKHMTKDIEGVIQALVASEDRF
ncbi:MAG: aminotransferase class I/II-fold pyridoxal phosphate-dependent enzyme [Hyphomicrobiaceae bacterium]